MSDFKINVSQDSMQVTVSFFPSDENKDAKQLEEDIRLDLKTKKITYGIDEKLISSIGQGIELEREFVIAEGKEAVQPIPSKIEHYFNTSKDFKPEIDENGNINYHKLNNIAAAKENQLLAKLIPEVPGQNGFDVYGKKIPCGKPQRVRLRGGRNTYYNEDKTELFSTCDGLVQLMDDEKIVVRNVYEVPNNIGSSTGDIEFDGSVIVRGNILTGFKLIAKGDIEVYGAVEGAYVKAGGDLLLHSGVQGMGRGYIEADGNIFTRYIEQATVKTKGDIEAEAIMHSQVVAKGSISVQGKRAMITGGKIKAGVSVDCKTLGSHMGTQTEVEVGMDAEEIDRYNKIKKELPRHKDEEKKLEQVIELLNKRKEIDGALSEDKLQMYMSALRNKIILSKKIAEYNQDYEELEKCFNNRNLGEIIVRDVVYPGVSVTVGPSNMPIREQMKAVKFVKEGADVRMKSL